MRQGRYTFTTIKPGPTRGATTTTPGARRTSISRCSAARSRSGWSRRCTSPATRSSPYDPIFNSVGDERARERMIVAPSRSMTPSPTGRPRTTSTSTCADRARRRSRRRFDLRDHAVADRRAVLRDRPAVGRRARGRARPIRRGAIRISGRVSTTARARRSPTSCSRPGRPIPTAASPTCLRIRRPSELAGLSRLCALRRSRTATARSSSSPSSRDRCRGPAATTQAPHVDVSVFARGMLNRCVTRIYFADEAAGQCGRPRAGARPARIAATRCSPSRIDGGYAIDIRIQGDGETVFFAI